MEKSDERKNTTQHKLIESIVLHLLPGLFLFSTFISLTPVLQASGIPPILTFSVLALITCGLELGIICTRESIPLTKIWGSVLKQDLKLPKLKFVGLVLGFLVIGTILISVLSFFDQELLKHLHLPEWFVFDGLEDFTSSNKAISYITVFLFLVITAFIVPIIEEIYFRGYLLQHMPIQSIYGAILNAFLFTIYHTYSFYSFFGIFGSSLVLAIAYWKYGNIKLVLSLHVTSNILTKSSIAFMVLRALV
jgi:membrane protease YdiL (CAAX protease family)